MSGSSLDGLDLCKANFSLVDGHWEFAIIDEATIPLSDHLIGQLKEADRLSGFHLARLDVEFGEWISEQVLPFSEGVELIGLHGHTVYHDPSKLISLQIGSGEVICARTNISTVSDFRTKDVVLGGQGAPLVPMGEKLLFPEYDAFLNLGGICNATIRTADGIFHAGDIGPCNQVLNHYAEKLGKAYDDNGKLAADGRFLEGLYDTWNTLDFFREGFPKSLANNWVKKYFHTVENEQPADVLRTYCVFIADQIAKILNKNESKNVLVTGGGAFNSFLMELIREKTSANAILPETQLVVYKEALIFGFLGLLKVSGMPNVLSSCTGSARDSSSGHIYDPD